MAKDQKREDEEVVRQQQHTGNHDYPGQEQGGTELYGGTRAGAENVESTKPEERSRPDKRPETKQKTQQS